MQSNPLADALRPGMDLVVRELQELGWKAVLGSVYEQPYIRVYSTRMQLRIHFDNRRPFTRDADITQTKRWVWYVSSTNFDNAWFGDFQGELVGLGQCMDSSALLLAVQAIIFDPCAIQNLRVLELDSEGFAISLGADSITCPICKPRHGSKVWPVGRFDSVFGGFSRATSLGENLEYQRFLASFFYEASQHEITSPQLNLLRNRFEEDIFQKQNLRKIEEDNLRSGLSSWSQVSLELGLASRNFGHASGDWFVLGNRRGWHKVSKFTKGGAFRSIETQCGLLSGEVHSKPAEDQITPICQKCLGSDLGLGGRLPRWQPTDASWAMSQVDLTTLVAGQELNLGFAQPICIPSELNDTAAWGKAIAASWGPYSVLLSQFAMIPLGISSDCREFSDSVSVSASKSVRADFRCLNCHSWSPNLGIDEYVQSPEQQTGYTKSLTVGSLLRVGPRLLCSDCRSKTYGTKYKEFRGKSDVLNAINAYTKLFGTIPNHNWIQKPLFADFPSQLSQTEFESYAKSAVGVLSLMPNLFSGSRSEIYLRDHPNESGVNWWELLHQAGLVSKFKKGILGMQGESSDGHWCLSLLEWNFCNSLHANNVPHIKEPRYGSMNKTRADYQIGDFFVEIAGLLDNEEYVRKLQAKLAFAKEIKRRVIVFTPKQVEQFTRIREVNLNTFETIWENDVRTDGLSALAFS